MSDESGERYPMRGVIPWRFTSMPGRRPLATPINAFRDWPESGTVERGHVNAYTNSAAMLRIHGGQLPRDVVYLQSTGADSVRILRVDSHTAGLILVPSDAPVLTTDWGEFLTNTATAHNFARSTRGVATRPLREVIDTDSEVHLVEVDRDGYPTRRRVPPGASIANLEEFDTPPAAQLAAAWGTRIVPAVFLDSSADHTVEVSRVPGFLAKYFGRALSYGPAYELAEGLAEVLNTSDDPQVLQWALTQMTTASHDWWPIDVEIRRSLPNIGNTEVRARFEAIVSPQKETYRGTMGW